MIQTTVKVSGMACSMCEAHINDAIRGAFPVEKTPSAPLLTPPATRRGRSMRKRMKKRDCFISEKRRTEFIPVVRLSGHRFEINKIHIGG